MQHFIVIPMILIFGWLIGKLINYLSDIITNQNKYRKCPYCGREQSFFASLNFSYTCLICGAPYSKRIWGLELISALLVLWLWFYTEKSTLFWIWVFSWLYFSLTVIIDWETHHIPHLLSFYGCLLGLIFGNTLHGIQNCIIGGGLGFFIAYIFFVGGILYTRTIGKKKNPYSLTPALGFGDVILCGVLGLYLGWQNILPIMFEGLILAICYGLILITYKYIHQAKTSPIYYAIPLAPFLIVRSLVLLLFSV